MKAVWVWNKLVFTGMRGKFVMGMALCWSRMAMGMSTLGPGETEAEGISLVAAYEVSTERSCFCCPQWDTQGDLEATIMK